MFLLGFKVQDPNSNSNGGKVYTAVATPTGYVHTSYGPAQGTKRPSIRKNFPATGETDSQKLTTNAYRELPLLWQEKVERKTYGTIVIKPTMLQTTLTPEEIADPKKTIAYFEKHAAALTSAQRREAAKLQDLEKAFLAQKFTTDDQVLSAGRPRTQAVNKRAATIKGEKEYYRPNGDVYRPRDLGGHHDVALVRTMRTAGIPVRLYGLPGTGKSALAEAAFGRDLITINGHGDMTVSNFVGCDRPQSDGTFKWADGPLTQAMKEGRPLFVDEITRIPTEVLAVLYSVLDGRNTLNFDDKPDEPVLKAAKGFYVLCGYNPEGIGVRQLDDALVSRFALGVEVTTDMDAARALGVPPKFIRFASNLKTKHTKDVAEGGPGMWVPQMRELLLAKKVAATVGSETFAASVIVGQCPRPEDLTEVAKVATSVFGETIKPLALGGQVI